MVSHPDYQPKTFGNGPGKVPPNLGPQKVSDRGVDLDFLFGKPEPKPREARKYEQFWHRTAAYMAAACRSPKEIADACDVSYASVLALMRNPWFQQTVFEIQKENGAEDDIQALFKGELRNSFQTLVEIRDDPKAPASVRRASAVDILERVMGKAAQVVTVDTTVRSTDPVAEAERLEREVAALRQGPSGIETGASSSETTASEPLLTFPSSSVDYTIERPGRPAAAP